MINQRWTKEADKLLAQEWPKQFSKCAHMFPGRTLKAVRQRAQVIGATCFAWTEEEKRLLAKLWPTMGSNCVTAFPTRTKSAIRDKAVSLGLKRSSNKRGLTFRQMERAAEHPRCVARDTYQPSSAIGGNKP